MHELAGARRCPLCEIALLAKQDFQPTTSGIARDARPLSSPADDGDVDQPVIPARDRCSVRHRFLLRFFSARRGAAVADERTFIAGFGGEACRP
jgi:hypothetical protein